MWKYSSTSYAVTIGHVTRYQWQRNRSSIITSLTLPLRGGEWCVVMMTRGGTSDVVGLVRVGNVTGDH